MNRWDQIEELFHAALQLRPGEWDVFLAGRCSGDDELRRQVQDLLAQRSAGLLDLADRQGFHAEEIVNAIAEPSGVQNHPWRPALLPESRVGPYQIEAFLGRGGMGEVYRARDTRLGRAVALKFLSGAIVGNPALLERFRREAQAISRLNHPNVCTVYDVGEQAGQPFLVMELLEGQTLKDRISEGPLSNSQLLDIMLPVLDGLEAAHTAGIVHRDIKPANIFLTRQGLTKLFDFGLAKSSGPDSAAPGGMVDGLTLPGIPIGTIAYMSPEQALGGDVDARSDLFACGVVLYLMATGALPFAGDSWATTREAVLRGAARTPRDLRGDLMPEIESVIKHALEKDPRDRCQSAAGMRAELLRARLVLQSQNAAAGGAPFRPPRRSGSWIAYAAAGLAALLIAAFAGWYFGAGTRPVTSPSEYVQLTDFVDSVTGPALSPDGRMVAFFRGGSAFLGTGPIYVKLLPNGQAARLTDDPNPKYGLAFTPDGTRVAYTAVSPKESGSWSVWTVPVTGGAPARFMRNAAGLTWIGKGRVLFSEVMEGTALHMGIVTSQESRADEREIYFPSHVRGMAHYSIVSPDQQSLIVVEMDGTGTFGQCRLLSMAGGSEGRKVGPQGACLKAAWSPNGKWMYFDAAVNNGGTYGATHIWRQRLAGGAPEQITDGAAQEQGLAMAPDGKSLISSVGLRKASVWIHDASGERSLSAEGSASNPKFSADGKRVYYLLSKGASGASELWSTDRISGSARLWLPGVSMIDFDISQDGQTVAYTAGDQPRRQIFVAPLDGSAPPRLVVRGGDEVSFGPPGELVFRQIGAAGNYLARIKTDGTGLERVQNERIGDKAGVSPDGNWAIVLTSEVGPVTHAVSLKDQTGKDPTRRTVCVGPCWPYWSPDGAYLYVTSGFDPTTGGTALVLPVGHGQGLPDLPPAGLSDKPDEIRPGTKVIRHAQMAPGPDPDTYAFVRSEFVGNLFRIPIH